MEELKVRDIMQTNVITVGPRATVRQLAELGFAEILLKPYELPTLLGAVHRQLTARR